MASTGSADLVIVANRLPVDRVTLADGTPGWRRSPGGLVTAIEPVLRANDRHITIEEIQKRVCEHYNIRMSDMHSARRARAVSRVIARPTRVA